MVLFEADEFVCVPQKHDRQKKLKDILGPTSKNDCICFDKTDIKTTF